MVLNPSGPQYQKPDTFVSGFWFAIKFFLVGVENLFSNLKMEVINIPIVWCESYNVSNKLNFFSIRGVMATAMGEVIF
ncbi:MAG: hypothetical protein WCW56_03050 [Candidatus Paceibacterota bacterium]|jgi:hypothetical protein